MFCNESTSQLVLRLYCIYSVCYLLDLVCICLSMLGKVFSTYSFCSAFDKVSKSSVHIILTSFIVKFKIPNTY